MSTVELDERLVNEEYKIWKRNTPFLYDIVMSHALEWPSLSISWYPDKKLGKPGPYPIDYTTQSLLIGTHTADGAQNHLMVGEVRLPIESAEIDTRRYVSPVNDEHDAGGYCGLTGKLEIVQRINHDGEINRARYMPQRPTIVATKSPYPEICVFDTSRHKAKPSDDKSHPHFRLVGHTAEGFGLDWSPLTAGRLASGSDDHAICIWDLSASLRLSVTALPAPSREEATEVEPMLLLSGAHTAGVNDVAWHHFDANMLGSVGDDCFLHLWDIRSAKSSSSSSSSSAAASSSSKPSQSVKGHRQAINCLAFSPHSEYLVISGSTDKTIGLWDIRQLSNKLHSFETHAASISQVQWSPHVESVFASCGEDRRVNVWDMTRIGEEQSPEDGQDGPSELVFIHGGHTDKVSDFSWNLNEPWVIASVAENNLCQVWQMARSIYAGSDGVVEEGIPSVSELE